MRRTTRATPSLSPATERRPVIRRFLTSALLAGFLAGLAVTLLQSFTTTPLIVQAETYEHASPGPAAAQHAHDRGHGADSGWMPAGRMERLFFTAVANVIAGVGFAFLLVACFAFWDGKTTGRTGVIWGMAGFAIFTLAPSLGLAPELPATQAAGLMARQTWWILTAAATAAGMWLLAFPRKPLAAAVGIAAIAAPHLIGAPHPHDLSAQIPPELAAQFAAASIVTSAVFWACLGWLAGTLYGRDPVGERRSSGAPDRPRYRAAS